MSSLKVKIPNSSSELTFPQSPGTLSSESSTVTRSTTTKLIHTWTIDHFSYHCDDQLTRHQYIESARFSPFKHNPEQMQFFVRLFPRQDSQANEINEKHIKISARMESSKSTGVLSNVKVSLLKRSGEQFNTKESSKQLSEKTKKVSWTDYLKHSQLFDSANELLPDDELTVYCEIELFELISNGFIDNSSECFSPIPEQLNVLSRTWSQTNWAVDNFSHVWTIDNFSKLALQNLHANKHEFISSEHFSSSKSNESKFFIKLHPNGTSELFKDSVSIFLTFLDYKTKVERVLFRLSILNSKGNAYKSLDTKIKFKEDIEDWGLKHFVSRETLLDSTNGILLGDRLTISCTITLLLDIQTVLCANIDHHRHHFSKQQAIEQTLNDFDALLRNKTLCDVTFLVGTQKFPAHKLILSARSPVFARMFSSDMKESKENKVRITDVRMDVFDMFLKFIYTGKVGNIEEIDDDLLVVADKYQIDSLKQLCETSLCSKLSFQSATNILVLADMHNAANLKANAIDYIKCERSSIMELDSFKNLIKSHSELAHEVICATIKRFKKC